MSVAKILEEIKSFSVEEIEALGNGLRLERLRRTGRIATAEESWLLSQINTPLPQTERFIDLRSKLQDDDLSDDERSEMLEINNERKIANGTRVKRS